MLILTGPVIRVGPNELSFADPGAVREIYTSDVFIKEESFYVSTYARPFSTGELMRLYAVCKENFPRRVSLEFSVGLISRWRTACVLLTSNS